MSERRDQRASEVEAVKRWAGRQLHFEQTLERLRGEGDPTTTPPRTKRTRGDA